jgi:hypothetical protein
LLSSLSSTCNRYTTVVRVEHLKDPKADDVDDDVKDVIKATVGLVQVEVS